MIIWLWVCWLFNSNLLNFHSPLPPTLALPMGIHRRCGCWCSATQVYHSDSSSIPPQPVPYQQPVHKTMQRTKTSWSTIMSNNTQCTRQYTRRVQRLDSMFMSTTAGPLLYWITSSMRNNTRGGVQRLGSTSANTMAGPPPHWMMPSTYGNTWGGPRTRVTSPWAQQTRRRVGTGMGRDHQGPHLHGWWVVNDTWWGTWGTSRLPVFQ